MKKQQIKEVWNISEAITFAHPNKFILAAFDSWRNQQKGTPPLTLGLSQNISPEPDRTHSPRCQKSIAEEKHVVNEHPARPEHEKTHTEPRPEHSSFVWKWNQAGYK